MSFWARTWGSAKTWLAWMGTKILGPLLAILLVLGAFLLLTMGFKELRVGGLLGWLLGRSDDRKKKVLDIVNSVDEDRVDRDGRIINPGTPDSKGHTQAVVVPIQDPGLLSDPKKVVFIPPGEDKPTEVVLPDGVTSKDVDQVVVINPEVVVISVKHDTDLPVSRIDDLVEKYGDVR